jgi:SAM-dependent methyltransferase
MTQRTGQLKKDWDERGKRLGSTKRAVLFKRFPGWLNESIHRRHTKFVLDNLPVKTGSILDVGCGYGRISGEIGMHISDAQFQGVDLCTEFANEYSNTIGPCFNGPVQEFHSERKFDAIIIVTTLMYLLEGEHRPVLEKLWLLLNQGGRIICIEPASEIFALWRRLTGRPSASPTGGNICHFSLSDLMDKFTCLEGARIINSASVTLLPHIKSTSVHHAVAALRE